MVIAEISNKIVEESAAEGWPVIKIDTDRWVYVYDKDGVKKIFLFIQKQLKEMISERKLSGFRGFLINTRNFQNSSFKSSDFVFQLMLKHLKIDLPILLEY